ncbi:MAG: hypothetical protein K0S32_4009 [Bacteroidetes bacterium]|nr:hypothetical protein [Bacteroidota bacterium]
MKQFLLVLATIMVTQAKAQFAHDFDLIKCYSTDGINWTNKTLFQDSSGVPSVVQHSTGTLYCAFQWFPAPAFTPSNTAWDKIAIKKSTDGGLTWGQPTVAVMSGYPSTYLRGFDPTLAIADNGQIRMYFSGSKTSPLIGLDSTVHMYSGISSDGVNYTWEPGVRVLVDDSVTIDPAVHKLGSTWHYTAPRGMPSAGAFHFISNDGLAWTRTTTIASDASHNWTGNLMMDGTTMKFYGTPSPQGGLVWMKSTTDAYIWSGYTNCNGATTSTGINADPAVIKLGANNYMMIYVSSLSVTVGMNENEITTADLEIYPNPGKNNFSVKTKNGETIDAVTIYDVNGRLVLHQKENTTNITHDLSQGLYFVEIKTGSYLLRKKLLIE